MFGGSALGNQVLGGGASAQERHISVQDMGIGSDALSIFVSLKIQDSGIGSDKEGLMQKQILIQETGTAVDSPHLFVRLKIQDSGIASDALSSLFVNLKVQDTGIGSDALGKITAFLKVQDSGSLASEFVSKKWVQFIKDYGHFRERIGIDVLDILVKMYEMLPSKFRCSQRLKDYLESCDYFANQLGKFIKKLQTLRSPRLVPEEYLKYLAYEVGAQVSPEVLEVLGGDYRKFISSIVSWWKHKGLYEVLKVIAYIVDLRVNIWDMWTNDYSTFVKVDPSVNDYENEHPGYYKSPHFGYEVVLDRRYGDYPNYYLWKEDMFPAIAELVEQVRPVNTVPHYGILLNPKTKEDKQVMTVPGEIHTVVTNNWVFTRLYFDTGVKFDDGKFFDWTYESAVNNITKWKLANGNKNQKPSPSQTSLGGTVLAEGTIDKKEITPEKLVYEFLIPQATELENVSELGLYLDDGSTLMVVSNFPNVTKTNEVEWRIRVEIYK